MKKTFTRIRTHRELIRHKTFLDRFRYLKLYGVVGEETFGYDRWINQKFYRSREWKQVREKVIARDLGCDLGIVGRDIHHRIIIHHMNPMSVGDLINGDDSIVNLQYLITTTHQTHNAIHYGDEQLLPQLVFERRPGDTTLW